MNFRYKKILSILAVCFVALLLIFFLSRNSLLNFFLNRKLHNYEERFHTHIVVSKADFNGLTGLLLEGITVGAESTDTLLKVDSVFFNVRILPLITGKIRFSNLEISNTFLHLINKKERDNFSFLVKKKDKIDTDSISLKANYGLLAEELLKTIFDAVPPAVTLKKSEIKIENDSLDLIVNIPTFVLKDHEFHSQINFVENEESRIWVTQGSIYPEDKKLALKIFPSEKASAEFPVIKQKWKLTVAFDTLQMNLSNADYEGDELQLRGNVSAQNLLLNHWRISPNDVVIKNQTMDFLFRVGTNFVALDSSSVVTYNKVFYHPFVKFQI